MLALIFFTQLVEMPNCVKCTVHSSEQTQPINVMSMTKWEPKQTLCNLQHALKVQHLLLIYSECRVLTIRHDVSQEPAVSIIMCGCSRYISVSVHIYKRTTSHPRREAASYCRLLNLKYGILEVSCDYSWKLSGMLPRVDL